MFVPQKNANKKLPKKALSVASVKGHKIMSEKMKIKDLAQELGINVKELQKDCSKLNIEATKSTLTEDDVQKIKEYRQAHANDKIEQRETESGVIVRRRKTEPAKAETKKEEKKPAEAKADAQKTAADEQTEKTEKGSKTAEKTSGKTAGKTAGKASAKPAEKDAEANDVKAEKPKTAKAAKTKKVIDTPAKIITPAKTEQVKKAEAKAEDNAEAAAENKTEVKAETMAETVKEAVQTETKQDKPKTEQKAAPKEDTRPREAKKAPLVSAVPDDTATKSILPPVGTKKTEAPEAKKIFPKYVSFPVRNKAPVSLKERNARTVATETKTEATEIPAMTGLPALTTEMTETAVNAVKGTTDRAMPMRPKDATPPVSKAWTRIRTRRSKRPVQNKTSPLLSK